MDIRDRRGGTSMRCQPIRRRTGRGARAAREALPAARADSRAIRAKHPPKHFIIIFPNNHDRAAADDTLK
ncbi:hypothetical protein EVAR_60501_1 [Eumeta japonica]|uniref:Uncharacterized protein n=1 Tax=Eumeta variegata TaxID=151549 RepID=A0A4C1ZKT2_EUMVA|nr:hypothetical protein EVAR_60501_1 [Eumeta japonica]